MKIKTSKGGSQQFFRYGKLIFAVNKTVLQLISLPIAALIKIPQYKDYLFLPFTDNTSAAESYGGGRYIGIIISDIKDNKLIIDFNKAIIRTAPVPQDTVALASPIKLIFPLRSMRKKKFSVRLYTDKICPDILDRIRKYFGTIIETTTKNLSP